MSKGTVSSSSYAPAVMDEIDVYYFKINEIKFYKMKWTKNWLVKILYFIRF